jgi:hypothetical protein
MFTLKWIERITYCCRSSRFNTTVGLGLAVLIFGLFGSGAVAAQDGSIGQQLQKHVAAMDAMRQSLAAKQQEANALQSWLNRQLQPLVHETERERRRLDVRVYQKVAEYLLLSNNLNLIEQLLSYRHAVDRRLMSLDKTDQQIDHLIREVEDTLKIIESFSRPASLPILLKRLQTEQRSFDAIIAAAHVDGATIDYRHTAQTWKAFLRLVDSVP